MRIRVDEVDFEVLEETGVARGQCCSAHGHRGDLHVTDLHCPAGALTPGGYDAGGECGWLVKWLYPALELVGQ